MTAGHLGVSSLGTELLDDPGADPAAVTRSLRNVARANRWFGGVAAALYGLGLLLRGLPPGRPLTLLDIGTGAGDLPQRAVTWARRRGHLLRPLGLELSRPAAGLAGRTGIPCVVACAGAPPLRERSVDIVLVSQVAHHFTRESAMRLFRTCDALARVGVVVADLRRGRLAPLAFRVGAAALRFDPITKADGLTSIRRGYTAGELRELLLVAGIHAEVAQRPGYRLVATWRTCPPARSEGPWPGEQDPSLRSG
ncbi:MAG TPA: methyltransferase domain-containing protein [Gemmatimonadales bacterium]|nr:methyltransferase domain-containing protein [Gemmatimonadales bacterium]